MATLLHVLGKTMLHMHRSAKMGKGDVYEAAIGALLLPQCLPSIVHFHYSMLLELTYETLHSRVRQSSFHIPLCLQHQIA